MHNDISITPHTLFAVHEGAWVAGLDTPVCPQALPQDLAPPSDSSAYSRHTRVVWNVLPPGTSHTPPYPVFGMKQLHQPATWTNEDKHVTVAYGASHLLMHHAAESWCLCACQSSQGIGSSASYHSGRTWVERLPYNKYAVGTPFCRLQQSH